MNRLRTDYIADIGNQFQPMQPTMNALAIRGAEANIAGRNALTEATGLNNELRKMAIKRQPFENEKEMVDFYIKTRPLATAASWPAYRKSLIDKGLEPSIIPEQYDPEYVQEVDTDMQQWLMEQTRKQAGWEADEARKEKAFNAKMAREAREEKAKLDKLKSEGTDKSNEKLLERAHKFISKMAADTGNPIFDQLLAKGAGLEPIDSETKKLGREAVPKDMRPLYDAYLAILEKEAGVSPEVKSKPQQNNDDPLGLLE